MATQPSTPAYEPPDPERPSSSSPTEQQLEKQSPVGRDTAAARHDPYLALRFRDYRVYSLGWVIAVIGQTITTFALGWQVYDLTGSKSALGIIGGIQAIPLVVLALPSGVLADMFDRRRIIFSTTLVTALASLVLWRLPNEKSSVPWMYAALLLWSTALTIGRPARSALLPITVPTHAFSNAVTWNSSFFQLSAMAGPFIAAMIVWLSHARWAYFVDACCAVFFGVMIMRLPRRQALAQEKPRTAVLENLVAGIHFVRRTRIVLATLTLDLFAVLLGGAVYLLPVFAKDILNAGPRGFGLLRAADAIGAFLMAILIAHLPPMKKAGRAMLLAVAAFGLATIGFGLSKNLWLSFVCLFFVGAFDNISVVVRHTLVQVLTPDEMRGRVSAVNNIFIGASNELGGMESGYTAQWFGPITSVVAGGVGTILTVIAIAFAFPQVLKYGSLQHARAGEPAKSPA
jgi:MFS family permease